MSEPHLIRVLYMEDDSATARLVQKRLQREHYRVDIAHDGGEGLRKFAHGSYDVVIIDQNMPVYEGLEIIRLLMEGQNPPPMIMVTGMGSEQFAVAAMKQGASDYIVKDVEGGYLELLPVVIQRVLEQRRILTQKQHAETALRESQALLQAVVDYSPTSIYVKDMHGRYIMANLHYAEVLQRSQADILGKTDYELFAARFAQERYATDQQILTRGAAMEVEEILPLADGPHTFLTIKFPIFDERGFIAAIGGIFTDITGRKQVEESLRRSAAELEQRVQARTAALIKANQDLETSKDRLQALSRRLVEVQEAERQTIARELHDEVGQLLTGLNLSLEMLGRVPADRVPASLEQARSIVDEIMQQVRELSLTLRPPMLDDLGLLPALLWHIERYSAQTGIQVDFKYSGLERRFLPEVEIAVYRIIQEALTNVARYARVNTVIVRLWTQAHQLELQIEDQGQGFDPEAALQKHESSGLSGLHERAHLLGGQLLIDSTPGRGSCIVAQLPLAD